MAAIAVKVLLIIPAYNEEESILGVVDTIRSSGYDYIVVNDGSTDKTAEICQEAGINLINLPRNLGIGGAVQLGHQYALQNGYDIDIQVDGDGQHDISYVPQLVQGIEDGADLVIGSRFVEQTQGFTSTVMRRTGITWLRLCIQLISGLTIYDSTSGFRACGKRAISLFARTYPYDYPEPESIVRAHRAGLSIKEVPVSMRERQGGVSSISPLKSIYYMVKVSLAVFIEGFGSRNARNR
ncbi:MAG: glycosyltransferase family 2 protein [Atopobiaceae bacterium]|nr:glycosyltransferase family 2 protein [Atopobiaceae bacterium]